MQLLGLWWAHLGRVGAVRFSDNTLLFLVVENKVQTRDLYFVYCTRNQTNIKYFTRPSNEY
jgi:hypothetical protein